MSKCSIEDVEQVLTQLSTGNDREKNREQKKDCLEVKLNSEMFVINDILLKLSLKCETVEATKFFRKYFRFILTKILVSKSTTLLSSSISSCLDLPKSW